MNKLQTFEDYLRDFHASIYTGTDDDMSDEFDTWLVDLQVDAWIRLGDIFAKSFTVEYLEKKTN